MSDTRVVPVAYVTKWALTAGIKVVKNAEKTEGGGLYRNRPTLWASRWEWTEDREVAKERWRKALEKEHRRLVLKAGELRERMIEPPPFTEET